MASNGNPAMNTAQHNVVSIPKWLHLVFIVLSMVLVYRLTVWSEGEVRDERYYQRSMPAAELVRQFAEKLFAGTDASVLAEQYIAQDVTSPVGSGRAALQRYYAELAAAGAQLQGVAGSGDAVFLHYSVAGETRIDLLRVQAGEIVAHSAYTQAGTAD